MRCSSSSPSGPAPRSVIGRESTDGHSLGSVMSPAYPLEPSLEEMRVMGEAALRTLIDFVSGLDDAPASDHEGALEMAARFREEAPEFGESFDKVLASVIEASSKSVEYAGPGFFA